MLIVSNWSCRLDGAIMHENGHFISIAPLLSPHWGQPFALATLERSSIRTRQGSLLMDNGFYD